MLSPTDTLFKVVFNIPQKRHVPTCTCQTRLDTFLNSWVFLGSVNKSRVPIKQTYGFQLILASPNKIGKWKAWTYYQLNIIRLCAILSIMVQTLSWLVVWNIWIFFHSVGNLIFPTGEVHHFQRGWFNHQPDYC